MNRREMIVGMFAASAAASLAADAKKEEVGTDQTGSADNITFTKQGLDKLRKKLNARGTVCGVELSRIILGGNPFGGWAHCRDLNYVNTLVKAYNTHEKIMETFRMCEEAGINAFLSNPALAFYFHDYQKLGGKIKFISDSGHKEGVIVGARQSVEAGASLIYAHGFTTDKWMAENDWKAGEMVLKEMRKLGVPVGLGAHSFKTMKFLVEHDLIPDFWMKTIHPTNYWSFQKDPRDDGEGEPGAEVRGWHDNCWCRDPEALAAWFEKREEPWIAFKTMAAGAVPPKEAIPFAFEHGADYICMGMMDFQVVENVNIATEVLDKGFPNRKRKWH